MIELLLRREVLLSQVSGRSSADLASDCAAEGPRTSPTAGLFGLPNPAESERVERINEAYAPHLADAERAFHLECADVSRPLGAIALGCGLDDAEVKLLALCAATELSGEARELAGHAGGPASADPPARRVDVALALRLLGPDALLALAPDGRLARSGLIEIQAQGPLADAPLILARQVIWRLLDDVSLDPELPIGSEVIGVPIRGLGEHALVLVPGTDPTRRLQTALLHTRGRSFLVSDQPLDDRSWRAAVRQASLDRLGIILLMEGPLSPLSRHWIERADHLSFALCSSEPLALADLPRVPWMEIAAPAPEARDEEWSAVFGDEPIPGRRPTAEQLRLAAQVATSARAHGAAIHARTALSRLTSGTLTGTVRRVAPSVTWDDLVLAPAHEARLRELIDRYRQRDRVHGQWGLPLYPSPGVVALFSGPSGTGKTTSAEAIAHELGVDMFRVDLSALVSKYIGETEKNLEEIFAAAHVGDYLLLFDEADSLFGARSKVTDSKDRYANMEVSYLLQRLETYDGFVILTSNFQGNIDPAFLRRIHATVHFPVPDAGDRKRIWVRALARAPLGELDLGFLSEKIDLAGGAIRNAALSAAYLAAAEGSVIEMRHLVKAVSHELTKLGRRAGPELFGPWHGDSVPSI